MKHNARVWFRYGGLSACLGVALLLHGCGAGTSVVSVSGDSGQNTSRSLPLTGTYAGRLYGYLNNAYVWIVMRADATASITVQDPVSGRQFTFTGRLDSDRYFQATGPDLRIDGAFYGAYSPYSSTTYYRAGYRFRGQWTDPDGFTGDAEAWHEEWPPPAPSSGNSYDDWYDDWDYEDDGPVIDIGNGGGSSGGSGNGGYQPPSSGGNDPPNTGGGDPTDDDIILRRGE